MSCSLNIKTTHITNKHNKIFFSKIFPKNRIRGKKCTYSFKMAIGLFRSSRSATELSRPILCFWESSMASTIGTDILTTEPSPSRSELKWRVWRNSDSLIKPFNGLAQPSLSTWTHWRSIFESLMEGKAKACLFFESFWDSSTKSSTSFPPSGSINPHETRDPDRVLEVGRTGRGRFRDGVKRVFWVFGKDGCGIGVLRKREAIVAIEMETTQCWASLCSTLLICGELGRGGKVWYLVVIILEGSNGGYFGKQSGGIRIQYLKIISLVKEETQSDYEVLEGFKLGI